MRTNCNNHLFLFTIDKNNTCSSRNFDSHFNFLYIKIKKRNERLRKSGIENIDAMGGIQFEDYLSQLFRSQGYKVEVTSAAGDYGADLLLNNEGKKIVA